MTPAMCPRCWAQLVFGLASGGSIMLALMYYMQTILAKSILGIMWLEWKFGYRERCKSTGALDCRCVTKPKIEDTLQV